MTYDAWKTRSPDDEREPSPDDDLSELDLVYQDLRAKTEELKDLQSYIERLKAENKRMVSALWQVEDHLENRADIVDGSYGAPAPNPEMQLLSEVREALGDNIRF